MTIGERIGQLIKSEKRFTQKGMAEKIGIPSSTVNNWIKNGKDIPADLIIPICGYFGVSYDFLLTGSDSKKGLTTDELELLSLYNSLSGEAKRDFKGAIRIKLLMDGAAEKSESMQEKATALSGTRAV